MADGKYNRWQGLAIGQLSVSVALISSLALAGLGVGLSLLKDERFALQVPYNLAFGASLFLLVAAIFSSFGAVVSRLLDFRLTARKVRKDARPDYNRPLTFLRSNADQYGSATWRLFWASCICFALGASIFVVSVGSVYAHRIIT